MKLARACLLAAGLAAISCWAAPAAADQTPPPWGHMQETWTQVDVTLGFGLRSATMTVLVGEVEIPVHTVDSGDWNDPTNWNDIIVGYTASQMLIDLVADPTGATFVEIDLGDKSVSCPYSSFMSMGPTRRPVSIPIIEVEIPDVGSVGLEIGTYANYDVTVTNHIMLNQDAQILGLNIDGGTLELQDGYSLWVSRATVHNTGTIWKSTGSGGFTFPCEIINSGLIKSTSGGLTLSYLTNTGTLRAESGGTLSIPGGPVGGTIIAETDGTVVFRGTRPLNALTGQGTFCAAGYPDMTVFDGIGVYGSNVLVTNGNVLSAWGSWAGVDADLLGQGALGGARLWIAADHDLTLGGTGRLAMSNPGGAWLGAAIEAQGAASRLVVGPQYTVEGSGFLFSPVINHGTITGNRPNEVLILECGATNSGTLKSESGGALEILGRVEGGALIADATTLLYGATIHTDTPLTGSGRFLVGGWSQTSTLEGAPVQNTTVEVAAGSGLTAWGTWTNVTTQMTGTGPGGNYPWIIVPADEELVLAGSGHMILSNPGNASAGTTVYTGAGTSRLVNGPSHTIEGSGNLSGALLVNEGLVTANVANESLVLGHVVNSGVLKAESDGGMVLTGLVEGGRIISDSRILLSSATVRTGVPLTGSGVFAVGGWSTTSVLDGSPVEATTIEIAPGTGLSAWGTWTNVTTQMTGTGPTGVYPWLVVPSDQELVLAGSGHMILSNPGNASPGTTVYTGAGTSRLVNGPSHTIEGSGNLSGALLVNEGLVTANVANESLVLGHVINSGTLKAESDGGMVLTGLVEGGRIISDSRILLSSATVRTDVPLTGSGVFAVGGWSTTSVLDGSPVEATTIEIAPGTGLSAWGTWTNVTTQMTGTGPGGVYPWLVVPADEELVLAGSGHMILSNPGNASAGTTVYTGAGTSRLVNGPSHTIEGSGHLTGALLVNQGLVTANVANESLVLGHVVNSGVLKAESDGGMVLTGLVEGGRIISDSRILLTSATVRTDQALTGSGVFAVGGWSTTSVLDGSPVEATTIEIAPGTGLSAWGTWTNVTTQMTGTGPGGNYPWLVVPSDQELVLAGSGHMILSNPRNASPGTMVYTGAGTSRLVNGPSHTIEGSGFLYAAMLNEGTVVANVPNEVLYLGGAPNTNKGLLAARNGGVLYVLAPVDGPGRWQADGGTIVFGAVTITTSGGVDIRNGGGIQLNGTSMTGSDLTLDATSRIGVASTLALSGRLAFGMTDESAWSWGAGAVLEMTGGQGAPGDAWGRWGSLEVGGADLGPGPAGRTGNFHLENLIIADGAHVYLSDLFDNGNRGDHGFGLAEALYVDYLTLGSGAVLNTNGLRLYYGTLAGPGETIDTPAPEPATLALLVLGGMVTLLRRRRK